MLLLAGVCGGLFVCLFICLCVVFCCLKPPLVVLRCVGISLLLLLLLLLCDVWVFFRLPPTVAQPPPTSISPL